MPHTRAAISSTGVGICPSIFLADIHAAISSAETSLDIQTLIGLSFFRHQTYKLVSLSILIRVRCFVHRSAGFSSPNIFLNLISSSSASCWTHNCPTRTCRNLPQPFRFTTARAALESTNTSPVTFPQGLRPSVRFLWSLQLPSPELQALPLLRRG